MAGGKFTKAEIVDSIYEQSGMDKREIRYVLDAAFDSIRDALGSNRTVELRGFGSFKVRYRKGRAKARDPRTGAIISSLPHGVASFRPGIEIKRAVWPLTEPPNGEPPETGAATES
jgi:integration host factor subunit beta